MQSRKRIIASLLIFAVVFLIGVAGFKLLGGPEWSLLDSVYMTVITVATIGYGEIHDLSGNLPARIFATFFILISLGTIAFAVTSITAFVVEGELKNLLGRRKMEKEIAKLKGHYIVCGSDETAQTIIRELALTKKDFVVVEPLREKIDRLMAQDPLLYAQGDPAEDSVLLQAGIERAAGILLSLPTDEANLYVAVTARSLGPNVRIVAKGIDIKSHNKMKKAGADYVISPAFIGGMRMVSQMIRPAAVSFLDIMLYDKAQVLRVDDIAVEKDSPLVGKTLGESGIRESLGRLGHNALLVGIKRGRTGEHIFNPSHEIVIEENDSLIFIATPEAMKDLATLIK
jgi:voltage-gated potassium channel